MSLKTGQKIWLAPQSLQPKNLPGWWRATDSINVGLIPSTYITIVGQLKKKSESNQSEVPTTTYESPVIDENLTRVKENTDSLNSDNFEKDKVSFDTLKNEDIFEEQKENN